MFILWSSSALRYLTLLFFISDEAPPYDSLSRDHSAEGDVTVLTRAVTATDVFVFVTGATLLVLRPSGELISPVGHQCRKPVHAPSF